MSKDSPPSVLVGEGVTQLLEYAQEHRFAIPALNCTSSSILNAGMEAAAKTKSPVILQLSNAGGIFYAGRFLDNANQRACVAGCLAAAHHVHQLAELYGLSVLLHTDRCNKKLLPWFDGLLDINEQYFKATGKPLFSSHMLDLSEDPLEELISTCEKYLPRMARMGITLEVGIGVEGVIYADSSASNAQGTTFTRPDDVWQVYRRLHPITSRLLFAPTVAESTKEGLRNLQPKLLEAMQEYVRERLGSHAPPKPLMFSLAGGLEHEKDTVQEAIPFGVVKVAVDADTQWGYWEGLLQFYHVKEPFLQTPTGNPEGEDRSNKRYHDPRVWLRKCEESTSRRVVLTFEALGCTGCLPQALGTLVPQN